MQLLRCWQLYLDKLKSVDIFVYGFCGLGVILLEENFFPNWTEE